MCSDCNAAEGKAKLSTRDIHKHFSFSPAEIAQFVRPRPGAVPEIDFLEVERLWASSKADFARRLDIAKQLIRTAAAGGLATERSPGEVTGFEDHLEPRDLLRKAFLRFCSDGPKYWALNNFRHEFLSRSVSRDASSALPTRKTTTFTLSDAEYEAYVDPVSRQSWDKASKEWSCECCGRSRREIVRKSKSGRLTGGIRSFGSPVIETDPDEIDIRKTLFPKTVDLPVIRNIHWLSVCSDCSVISGYVAYKFPHIGEFKFFLEDLRNIIICSAHAGHDVDWEAARRIALTREPLFASISAYREFEDLLFQANQLFTELQRQGIPTEETLCHLDSMLKYRGISVDMSMQAKVSRWLADRCHQNADPENRNARFNLQNGLASG